MVIGIYWLLSKLDWLIYWIVSMFFRVIFDLADPSKVKIFEDYQIDEIAGRIYVVVGVLMLFKLVVSAIQYLMNPDSFDDKEKGLVGVLKRLVITALLITVMPTIFNFAFTIQGGILKSIPSIILGAEASNTLDDDTIGREMSYTVLQSFVRPQKGGSIGSYGDTNSKIHDIDSFAANVWKGCGIFSAEGCEYDYMIIISTICGGFLCYVLLSMGLDVAIRAIKIALIRMLAPIPISSYIMSKDKFNKFVKISIQVYADLFIRMLIIYVVIFVIQSLITAGLLKPTGMVDTGSWIYDMLLHIVIIIGLFMFAKNAPKFVTDLLGLPEIKGNDMVDMFKPAWQRAGGLAALGGVAAAGVANMANKYSQLKDPDKSFGNNLKNALKQKSTWTSGAAGAASAGFRGIIAAAQGKNAKEVNAAGYRRAIKARQNRELDNLNGVTWRDRTEVRVNDFMGLDTDASLAEGRLKSIGQIRGHIGTMQSGYNKLLEKYAFDIDVSQNTDFMKNFRALIDSNRTNIANGNSQMLKNLVTKIDTGQKISYAEVLAAREEGKKDGSGGSLLSQGLTDGIGPMKLMQKSLWLSSMDGTIRNMSGTILDELDRKNVAGKVDTDLLNYLAQVKQDIAENAVQINGDNKFGLPPEKATDVDSIYDVFLNNFKSFDNKLEQAEIKIRGEVNTKDEAAARASLQRRQANNKENK